MLIEACSTSYCSECTNSNVCTHCFVGFSLSSSNICVGYIYLQFIYILI